MNESLAKQKVVDAGIRLVESGLIARTWGNVSCRISDTHFVITPSGRDYLSLTSEDIVTVAISDLSYEGSIKPSGEKGLHGEIYGRRPEVNFVIHTHQENASVISAMGIDAMDVEGGHPLLGPAVPCTPYALPGTKKIREGVGQALVTLKGRALVLRNHGAVCFGTGDEEAFQVAEELEKACMAFLSRRFIAMSGAGVYSDEAFQDFAITRIGRMASSTNDSPDSISCSSQRAKEGFLLETGNGTTLSVSFGSLPKGWEKEAAIHQEIYQKHKTINHIIHSKTPNILAFSKTSEVLFPFVDDFAQIIGTKVIVAPYGGTRAAKELGRASAVFLSHHGALCCGGSEADASAVQMILEKCCKARLFGTLFEKAKPLGWFDSRLMRIVYLKKYSRQISSEVSK